MSFSLLFCQHKSAVKTLFFAALLLVVFISASFSSYAEIIPHPNEIKEMPVNFSAQILLHNEEKQIVIATGDVELTSGMQIVRADKITYYLSEDRVVAEGDVTFLNNNGDVFFSDKIELKNDMKEGFLKGLLAMLEDGSRLTAETMERRNDGSLLVLNNATYTTCKVCENDPNPMWIISAKKVQYDKEKKNVSYRDAKLEFLGVPVFYTPYLSHPDPTIKRKSGLLIPEYSWSDSLGTSVSLGYYQTFSQDRDMTVFLTPTASAGTLLKTEWRERFENGELLAEFSGVRSDRTEEDGSIKENRSRGHMHLAGNFDLTDTWRSGFDITRSSDKQYMRLYDISSESVFSNTAYLERFSGRDYSKVALYNFQDVRIGVSEEQPDVLPFVTNTMLGEPGEMLGGRWKLDTSLVALNREEGSQDMQRTSVLAEWERSDISGLGLVNTYRLSGRGDIYAIQNSDASKLDPTLDESLTKSRGMATMTFISKYPLIKSVFDNKAKAIVEPMAGINLSPDINDEDDSDDDIPNEDSIDIRFDSSNLFDDNRYPGIDRQEDGGRFNYGVKTSLYDNDNQSGKIFIGQSYRFYGERIFPDGSGLEGRLSDLVGQLQLRFSNNLDADYRFQFDNEHFTAKKHEAQITGGTDDFRVRTRYIYINSVDGTGFDESREQVYIGDMYDINKKWSITSSALVDIGEEPGLRRASAGISYSDECFSLSFKGVRKVADDASGENNMSFMFKVGLTNIGAFSKNEFLLGEEEY